MWHSNLSSLLIPDNEGPDYKDEIGRAARLTTLRLRAMIEQSDEGWLREYAALHAAILDGRYLSFDVCM
jgi:hypothetical protein